MLNNEKKVTIEWVNDVKENKNSSVTNSITESYTNSDKLAIMIAKIMHEEFPMIKDNSLLYNLVLYSLTEKMKTLQNVENALQYIKENNGKTVQEVAMKKGESHIKCSV